MVKPQKSLKFSGYYFVYLFCFSLVISRTWFSWSVSHTQTWLWRESTQTSNRYISNIHIYEIAYDTINHKASYNRSPPITMASFQIFIFFVRLLLRVPLLHCDGKGCWENKTKKSVCTGDTQGPWQVLLGSAFSRCQRQDLPLVGYEWSWLEIFVLRETDWTYTEAYFVAWETCGGRECETKGGMDPHDNNARDAGETDQVHLRPQTHRQKSTVCRRSVPFTIKRQDRGHLRLRPADVS